MKVYAVLLGDDEILMGVFSSEEKSAEAIEQLVKKSKEKSSIVNYYENMFRIEELELDKISG